MNFDEYLTEYYGFTTTDKKWMNMHPKAKRILRESFVVDTQKENDDKQLATLYPSNKQSN